jgi:hypothetical protein
MPYHESDHILNIANNILAGGVRLEGIEFRRQDESFLDGLGAQRIPDPTTAGDLTRRFSSCRNASTAPGSGSGANNPSAFPR